MDQDIMTIAEVAKYLKVERRVVLEYARRKKNPLPIISLNRVTKRVNKTSLLAWLEDNEI